jgi:hypothetical protein
LDMEFQAGQQFVSKTELKNKLAAFHIEHNMQSEVVNSNRNMLIVKCKNENCLWRLYAKTNMTGSWEVSTNPYEHSCYGSATALDHNMMTARLIADTIRNNLREDLEMTFKQAKNLVKQRFPTVEPSYNKIWRGKELAIADLFGSWEKSYEMLPSLLAAIQSSTIGTKYTLDTEPSTREGVHIFNRVAWAFGPCIEAWPYLRPVISIDAGFLSGRYAGKLFMACAYDAEQHLLPLAFAVVAGEESGENWKWFMEWLRREVVGPGKITVITDQHLGIRAVFEDPNR